MEHTRKNIKNTSLRKDTESIFDFKDKRGQKDYTNIRCCNCNKLGHIVKHCSEPITSYGVILYRLNVDSQVLEYLLICRKHSIGYIEFIRGNYNIDNIDYLIKIFKTMTDDEINNIYTLSFRQLWTNLWNNKYKYNSEYARSKQKFYNLKNNKYSIGIRQLVKKTSQYREPEWGFPKGRKNINERNIDTAVRECYEETNIKQSDYDIQQYNDTPITFKEEYDAFNNKTYKLIYYIGRIRDDYQINSTCSFNKYQQNEISKLGLYPLDKIITMIRPYYNEKIKLIRSIDTFIRKRDMDK
tara:strand:- start:982 stop:1875 length:894 start_codon:yes stop_codon:yes gene_type:complete